MFFVTAVSFSVRVALLWSKLRVLPHGRECWWCRQPGFVIFLHQKDGTAEAEDDASMGGQWRWWSLAFVLDLKLSYCSSVELLAVEW